MASATLANLDIASATYGGKDVYPALLKQYQKYMASAGLGVIVWSFQVGVETFLEDPNPNTLKVAVITYRWFMNIPGGTKTYSPYQTAVGRDGATITLSPTGQTFTSFSVSSPIINDQALIAAYWFDKDVTAAVQTQWNQFTSADARVNGSDIEVSIAALGTDPAPHVAKQCTIVYQKNMGNYYTWQRNTLIDLKEEWVWYLHLPGTGPPIPPSNPKPNPKSNPRAPKRLQGEP